MQAPVVGTSGLRIAWFFTQFPHPTETFLQREVRGWWRSGVRPRLYSFHAGADEFEGERVARFPKARLVALLWRLPAEWWRSPGEMGEFARRLFTTWPRDWLNYWENLYGAGVGVVLAAELRAARIQHVHAAWASLPAMAAWVVARLNGIPFSTGAHAYDLFEHGGDWFLEEKAAAAAFVHTSTAAGRRRLLARGVAEGKVVLSRRGLDRLPATGARGVFGVPMRLVCVARLVEKKGLPRQLGIYRALRAAGVAFEAIIVGEGPWRGVLENEIRTAGLEAQVRLAGHLPIERVWEELARADVLLHTGVVTRSGDRDGLPNVVPEAMAAGAIVVTAPAEGVQEAIEDGVTGLVRPLDRPEAWVEALVRVRDDAELRERLRRGARDWVETHFDAPRNAALVLDRICRAVVAAEGERGANDTDAAR